MSLLLNTKHYLIRTLFYSYIANMGDYPSCIISAINELAFKYHNYTIMVKVGIEESKFIHKYKKHLFSNVSFFQNNYTFRGYLNTKRLRETKTLLVLWDRKYIEKFPCQLDVYRDSEFFNIRQPSYLTMWRPPYLTIVLDTIDTFRALQHSFDYYSNSYKDTVAGNRIRRYKL